MLVTAFTRRQYMKYLILIIMLFSLEVSAMETVKIELKNHNNILILNLTNISQENILINKRFAIGAPVYQCEVDLIIMDKNGQIFPFDLRINIDSITDNDLLLLKPGKFIEKEYKIEDILYYYSLPVGQYEVKAVYKNTYWRYKGVFSDTLISNPVNIAVTETNIKNSKKNGVSP
jgi:hypothetical protein